MADGDVNNPTSVEAWEKSGRRRRLAGFEVFTVEVGPESDEQ